MAKKKEVLQVVIPDMPTDITRLLDENESDLREEVRKLNGRIDRITQNIKAICSRLGYKVGDGQTTKRDIIGLYEKVIETDDRLERRIDRIVLAHEKCKSLKGL